MSHAVKARTSDDVHQGYSSAHVIALVSDKWVIEVLHALRAGYHRYGELLRAIPQVTKKMLTQTLRKLERNGIIERIDYNESPPRIVYFITPLGDSLIVHLTQMCEWSKAYFASVEQARQAFDGENTA